MSGKFHMLSLYYMGRNGRRDACRHRSLSGFAKALMNILNSRDDLFEITKLIAHRHFNELAFVFKVFSKKLETSNLPNCVSHVTLLM